MGIYTGLIVHKPLTNQRRYEFVLVEIQQFLLAHSEEVNVRREGKVMTVEALYGSCDFNLPLSAQFLRSSFFRIHAGQQPPEDVKQFAYIVWECLNILKEHYPSKIELLEENLDRCAPVYRIISESEQIRRQISCLSSRMQEMWVLQSDEMEDLWYVLYNVVKLRDLKSISICLEILNNSKLCPPHLFRSSREEDIRLLEGMVKDIENFDYQQFPSLAQECIRLAESALQILEPISAHSKSLTEGKYELPQSFPVLMFQLGETACVERATFLLSSIDLAQNQILELGWIDKLNGLMLKYCDGIFGGDEHDVIRYGLFQYALGKAVVKLAANQDIFMRFLDRGFFARFFEITEEACLLLYRVSVDKDFIEEGKLGKFVKLSINLVKLTVSAEYSKHLPGVLESLQKLNQRLLSFTHSGSLDMPAPDDPEALRLVSEELYECQMQVKEEIRKIEGLLEYQDTHELKWRKLFTKDQLFLQMEGLTQEEREVYDRQLRVWGLEKQGRLRNSRVLLVNYDPLGAEIAKNLVLAGVNLSVQDDSLISQQDIDCNIFLSQQDLGNSVNYKQRVEKAQSILQTMNPLTQIRVFNGDYSDITCCIASGDYQQLSGELLERGIGFYYNISAGAQILTVKCAGHVKTVEQVLQNFELIPQQRRRNIKVILQEFMKGLANGELGEEVKERVGSFSVPACSVQGGILSNDVVEYITEKQPGSNILFFDEETSEAVSMLIQQYSSGLKTIFIYKPDILIKLWIYQSLEVVRHFGREKPTMIRLKKAETHLLFQCTPIT